MSQWIQARAVLVVLATLLAGIFAACSPKVQPADSNIYRTTEGGKTLSWELKTWPPNKSGNPKAITNAAAGGVEGGWRWQLKPDGDTVQLEGTGRNDRMALAPRAVVQLKVDGQDAFYGVVADPPSTASPDSEKVLVLGGREALRKVLTDQKVYKDMGVYTIARDLLSRLLPPSLTYDPTLIGDGSGTDVGPSLSVFYSPVQPLDGVLDSLAKSAGVTAGVDSQGRVFLGRPAAPALTVAYAGQPWRRLQVQGRETVSRSVVRILTAPAGIPDGAFLRLTNGVPGQVVTAAESAQHTQYRAEEANLVPEGVSVIGPSVPLADIRNTANLAALTDNDPTTYVELGADSISNPVLDLKSDGGRVVGFEVDYTYSISTGTLENSFVAAFTVPGSNGGVPFTPQDQIMTVRVLLPPSGPDVPADWVARLSIGAAIAYFDPRPTISLKIYAVRFLKVDEAAAQRVAASFLQLPYATPAEVTLPYLAVPSPGLIVTDSPDGDVSGDTALWEFEHSSENMRTTRIKLGATGQGETARAIKFAVQAR